MFAFLLKRLSPETEWHDLSAEKQKYIKGILWSLILWFVAMIICFLPFLYLAYRGATNVVLWLCIPISYGVIGIPKTIQICRNKIRKVLANQHSPMG